jgi:type IV pilus assembly protein PilA
MLKAFHNRMKDDKGFTLIELMVVVLIIAILIAIAIPTFLGLRERAQNRAAQSNLRNGLTAAKAHFTDQESYVGFNVATASAIEPSLTWNVLAAGSTVEGAVSIRDVAANTLVLVTVTANGDFFCIGENAGLAVSGNDDAGTAAACTGGF